MSVARMVWIFDDINHFEAEFPVDPFDGAVVSARDGSGNVHLFLQPPWFLNIQISEPGQDAICQYVPHCPPVEVL